MLAALILLRYNPQRTLLGLIESDQGHRRSANQDHISRTSTMRTGWMWMSAKQCCSDIVAVADKSSREKIQSMFHHIAYVSLSRSPLDSALLSDILKVSVQNNKRDGITGVLMHHDKIFFQVLEGGRSEVERCYARIIRDSRHTSIALMWDDSVEARVFSDWAMGYAGPDEIGRYTRNSFQSLADLASSENSTKDGGRLALELARNMFRDFKGSK